MFIFLVSISGVEECESEECLLLLLPSFWVTVLDDPAGALAFTVPVAWVVLAGALPPFAVLFGMFLDGDPLTVAPFGVELFEPVPFGVVSLLEPLEPAAGLSVVKY